MRHVQLSPQRLQEIGVTTATVELKNVNDNLSVPGNVDIDEERLSYVQTRFPGWIQNVFANATYQYVRKGQRLFTIYSPDLVSTEQEYLLAKQNQNAFAPDAHGMAAQESGWLLQAAEERLRQFGVPAQAITDLEQSGKVQRKIAVDSPASGYIIERNALPNAYVQPDTKLYTIADLSTVWVYANVFQNDVGRLKPGDPAAGHGRCVSRTTFQRPHRPDSAAGRSGHAHRARAAGLPQPGRCAQAGNVCERRDCSPAGTATGHSGFRRPAGRHAGHCLYRPRKRQSGAARRLKSVRSSTIRSSSSRVSSPESGWSARPTFWWTRRRSFSRRLGRFRLCRSRRAHRQTPRPLRRCRSTSARSRRPPRKGANTVRVKLTGADGKPVAGAQVTATFFMPAMPAMGMAAKRAAATLADKGNGLYEGPLQLESGGTWQVTVTVSAAADHRHQATQPERHGRHVMISRIIAWCARNPFLVFTGAILLVVAGVWCMQRVPLDALPDISDVQVIIHTPWAGEPPNVIEDQVTYPIVTALLSAPHVKSVRAQTMFGDSYVFVVFRGRHRSLLGAVARDRVSAADRRAAAGRRASGDRSGCNRRRLGLRVRHRRSQPHAEAWPTCARCRTGICAISSKPFPAWRKWRASADSCASTR